MKSIMTIPGLKDVLVTKVEEIEGKYALFIEVPKRSPICPACQSITSKVQDDCIQKMNHLKWFDWAKNSNGFLEGINNKTKVMKRHAYGYKRFDRLRAKILLTLKYKEIGLHLG
ncbi:transposase [Kurthia sibirica]|uniref:Transposase IS204/IS1001/IS1096/IS1165 DDE domain-containing protein n=2 Tax=Kurthia sibirica TaxID=202750 RepID=A0A2U3ALL8_9BACL|nr:hypothetical protein DEX24_08660 [Kurthia sibirica]